jgi:hypothetical protein
MQSTGDQLFARAAFASYEYRGGSTCSAGDRVTDVVDGVTRPDEAKIRGAGDRVANVVEEEDERASDGQDDAATHLSRTELTRAIEPHSVDANIDVAGSWADLDRALRRYETYDGLPGHHAVSDRPANVGSRNKKRWGVSGKSQFTVAFEKTYLTDAVKVRVPQDRERGYNGCPQPTGWSLEGAGQGRVTVEPGHVKLPLARNPTPCKLSTTCSIVYPRFCRAAISATRCFTRACLLSRRFDWSIAGRVRSARAISSAFSRV